MCNINSKITLNWKRLIADKVCRFLLDSKGDEFFPPVCHFCVSSDINKVLCTLLKSFKQWKLH